MSSLALALVVMIPAQNILVPLTGWNPPQDIDYRVDSTTGVTAPAPWLNVNHVRDLNSHRRLVDMACVVWGRTSGSAHESRCRASASVAIATQNEFLSNNVDNVLWSSRQDVGGAAWCQPPLLNLDECDFF